MNLRDKVKRYEAVLNHIATWHDNETGTRTENLHRLDEPVAAGDAREVLIETGGARPSEKGADRVPIVAIGMIVNRDQRRAINAQVGKRGAATDAEVAAWVVKTATADLQVLEADNNAEKERT